ncbi:MAG TPA: SpoIIE family protein phosphatase [Solirubrobacterales bacterium]|jgi:serine phosphatase RsbU (regulator of sigma subunit)/ketosteroid isomerase-like protein
MAWIEISAVALAALAVVLAAMLARERKTRRRFRILADVAAASDAGGSLEDAFDAICGILVPEFADFCMIDVIADDGVRRAAVRVAAGGGEGAEERLAARQPSIPENMLADDGSRSALAPRFFERISEEDLRALAHDADDLRFLKDLGVKSAVTVALKARERLTGALTLGVAWSGRRYRREDARFAWILSGRVALALDNAGLFSDLERAERARAEIADTLQRGLRPPPLPHIPGWSIAAMYQPAGAENEVGGDFYDAFRVPGGWMLAVGDVTGRGARAASITAVARYTLRTAAALTGDPVLALATLNRALLSRGDSALCSLVALVLSEDPDQPVRLAVAGHPPPLLVDGESVVETTGVGPVLGAFSSGHWEVVQFPLGLGQQLAIVTDGITEAQGGAGRFGEERLRAELRGVGDPALVMRRLESALNSFADGRHDDDVAILALTRNSGDALEDAQPALTEAAVSAPGLDGEKEHAVLVKRLYEAFNRRDSDGIAAVCDEKMEFFPIVTAEAVGRAEPYVGPTGLRDYLSDAAKVWEELLITPSQIEQRGDRLLVRGRVYARSRELGIRDMPVAWIWEVRHGGFVRGEVFPDLEHAFECFSAVSI